MVQTKTPGLALAQGDALIVVDVQNDFLPGGNLGVPKGEEVVPVLNRYIERFQARQLPVYATRDWHTEKHCSFKQQSGPWPPHCVADSIGAAWAPGLELPNDATVISKGTRQDRDAYSGFEQTELEQRLRQDGVRRLFIGGLATDYCVLQTVNDALKAGFKVFLLHDAIRAVNVKPDDGINAERDMIQRGAKPLHVEMVAP